jgi:hypothetical protein
MVLAFLCLQKEEETSIMMLVLRKGQPIIPFWKIKENNNKIIDKIY